MVISDIWLCPECVTQVDEPKRRGPHLSGCRRKAKSPYVYAEGDTHHPMIEKACAECGIVGLIQVRRDHCSRRCSKIGEKNPSQQKNSRHGLTPSQYASAHSAVRKARGSAFGCRHCETTAPRVYHWANISGDYFNVDDYINLCVPCHDAYDRSKGGE